MGEQQLRVIEICAGAGGQALGLEKAGFEHELAIELDSNAVRTLRRNRPAWKVVQGDVADPNVWDPADYAPGDENPDRDPIDLLAGGVPCPPFTVAGKQLGANDERDLFAWAVEQVGILKPRAVMLENVRGLSHRRFAAYRQHVLNKFLNLGYVAEWQLLQASDFGVPQLRPRFVLVALQKEDAPYFYWPKPVGTPPTVGETLRDLMASCGWEGADAWAEKASKVAPTIVGGSKKHGGADLGPTRAKAAWKLLGVDALGIANEPPQPGSRYDFGPKLTCEMVALLQGWKPEDRWHFEGGKTSVYRQIGNAFPPPVAEALGRSIKAALYREVEPYQRTQSVHDPVYEVLRDADTYLSLSQIARATGLPMTPKDIELHINHLALDFEIDIAESPRSRKYKLGEFRAFRGQDDHLRHEQFLKYRSRIS
ncbi:DNA cytosine methyltransferase [Sphaerisporangium melleum]|uniref:DNA (cytosine-5-)-methyltransferase n=1 Tax=Sphaerisporangium melleum TaxID=321316 RepID=A0A917QZW5_9ACTN|nr:DNA (cytosine-5-)-methyltransferase [Sphaerisporangium melleum]GGK78325.1 DNA cytosine methyltransferase [Sphaerisporangium melleum]GII69831.1 DNA cytosine methyltransferase [Sphaerisporangium melleum]